MLAIVGAENHCRRNLFLPEGAPTGALPPYTYEYSKGAALI